jgi:putative inorganic carbon (hco3(-)) transporter
MIGGGLLVVSRIGYQRDTTDPWTLNARISTWQLGLSQISQHPIVGVGYGNYTFTKIHAAEVEREKDKGSAMKVLSGLHNTFAMVLMGSGVPALILFVWTLVRTIDELVGGFRQVQLNRSGVLVLGPFVALAVIGFLTRNAFDTMFAGALASLFWILVSVGFWTNEHHWRNEPAESPLNRS